MQLDMTQKAKIINGDTAHGPEASAKKSPVSSGTWRCPPPPLGAVTHGVSLGARPGVLCDFHIHLAPGKQHRGVLCATLNTMARFSLLFSLFQFYTAQMHRPSEQTHAGKDVWRLPGLRFSVGSPGVPVLKITLCHCMGSDGQPPGETRTATGPHLPVRSEPSPRG